MACQVFRNPSTKEITKVVAPNRKESKLYQDILARPEIQGNKEAALDVWLSVYTDDFKKEYGDWESHALTDNYGMLSAIEFKRVSQYAKYKTAKDILEAIAKQSEQNDTRALAEGLLSIPDLHKLRIVVDTSSTQEKNEYALGVYQPDINVIYLRADMDSNTTETVFLHELIHGITVNEYDSNSKFRAEIDKLYNHMKTLGDRYTSQRGMLLKDMYGMKDVYEFMSEAMTNPHFQFELTKYYAPAKTQSTTKTIFQQFIDLITSVLRSKIESKDKKYIENNMQVAVMKVVQEYAKITPLTKGLLTKTDKRLESNLVVDENGEPSIHHLFPAASYNLSQAAEQFVYQQTELERNFRFTSGLTLMSRDKAQKIVDWVKKNKKYNALNVSIRGVNDGSRIMYAIDLQEKSLKEIMDQRSAESVETQKLLVNQVINRLAVKFPKLETRWITPDQLDPKEHAVDVSKIKAYVKNGVIYLVEGRATEAIAIEELLHPFVESLFQDNKALFTGLFNKGKEVNPRLWTRIQNAYLDTRGFTETDRKKELVTRVLQETLQQEITDNSERTQQELKSLLQRFFNWLSELFNEVFDFRTSGDMRVEAYNLPTKVTYEELAKIINTKKAILSTAIAKEKTYNVDDELDSQEVNTPKDRKLARVAEQQNIVRKTIADLKKIKGTDAKIATLEKILINLDMYRAAVQNDEFTVSVTNLIGGGELKNQELYEDFKQFGTFIHYVLENIQKQSAESGKKVTTIFNREMFDMLADSYPEDFSIVNLTRDEMYSMSQEMISYLQIYITKGYTLLPEISVFGKDRNNRNIIGRVDVLGIAPSGKVEILDLKTKKVYSHSQVGLLLNKAYPVLTSELTDPEFSKNRRSSYDSWDTQLSIYERLYAQSSIEVDTKTVLALIYRGDNVDVTDIDTPEKFQFEYTGYEFIMYTSNQRQQGSDHEKLNYANVMSVVKKVIPVTGETVEEAKTAKEPLIFNMKDEEYERLLNNLQSIAEEEIRKIEKSLSNLDENNPNDKMMRDFYKTRREAIRKIQDTFRQDSAKSQLWSPAYKLTAIMRYLTDNTQGMKETAQKIANISDQVEKARKLDDLKSKAVGFNYFLSDIRELLINLNDPRNNEAIKLLDSIQANIDYTMGVFNELGFNYLVDILKNSITPEVQERINKERVDSIDPLIKHLKDKLQKLRDKQSQGGTGSSISYSVWQGISNMARTAFKVPIDTQTEIEAIEVRIKSLELRKQGIKLDDKSVRQYIQGILDKNSLYYIGSDSTVLTDFIAAASNADIGIAGFANHLKFIEVRAKQLYLNFMERNKFQDMYDKFRKGKSDLAAINAPISEIREVIEYDAEGEPVVKRYRSFKDPVLESYKNVFKKYWSDMRKINRQIRATGDIDEKKTLGKAKATLIQQHKAWRLEHSQMPLVDEIYELDKFLPAEFKQRRDELYEEREAILAQVGLNEEEKLSEEDLEDLAEIEIALKKLKQETISQNASYQEYMEKMEKYYSYEPNVFFFERIMNSKQIEYADDPIMMKKWMEMNTYRTPSQTYFDKVGELYDSLFSILPQNDVIKEIKEKQRDILRAYKRNGYVDTRFLSNEDITAYEDLESQLQEIREGSGSIMKGLSSDDKDDIREIFDELNSLTTSYINPYYDRDYRSRVEALDQKLFLYNETKRKADEASGADKVQLEREAKQAMENFYEEEMIFEKWYNLNHYNQYESKLLGAPLNPVPKSFNFVKLPTDPTMMEVKPSFKYSIRKLKEEAKNKNYQETVDGFPMPKGMKIVDDVVVIEKTSQWVNPEYEALTKQTDNFDFYKKFVGQFLKMQNKTYGRSLGYLFPGFEETSAEIYKQKGFKEGFVKNFEIFKQKNFSASSIFDYSINEISSGNENMVRMKFNRPIDLNEAESTVDGIGSVIRWYEEAFINQAVGEAQPLVSATLSYLNNLYKQLDQSNIADKENRKANLKRVIDSYTFEYQKIIKGETKTNEGNMGKLGDTLLKAIGFTRLGFDMANQIGNYFSGNVQTFLGGHKTGQYNNKNLSKAKVQFYGRDGLMASLLRDSNKFSGFTFMTKMYLYFNPSQADLKNSFDKTRSTGQRLTQGALDMQPAFWIQDKGEIEISSTIWLAMMDNRRAKLVAERDPATGKIIKYQTNPDGTEKKISVFEAYTQNQFGEVVIRDDVDWTKDDERNLMSAIYSEIRRTQGNYASADKTRTERGVLGRFLVFYRKYLMPFVLNRFGARRDNIEAGEVAMGYYNALIRGLMYYRWKLFAGMIGKDDTVSPFYAKKAFYAVREIILASMLYILGTFLNSMVKRMDDDDDDNEILSNLAYHMLAIYIKVERETRSMVPVPIVGSLDEYINQFTDFTNFGRDITRVVKLAEHGIALGAAQVFDSELVDKAAYYQRKTGIFDKGDAKILKDIYDVSGFMNFYELYNPETRVEEAFKRR